MHKHHTAALRGGFLLPLIFGPSENTTQGFFDMTSKQRKAKQRTHTLMILLNMLCLGLFGYVLGYAMGAGLL